MKVLARLVAGCLAATLALHALAKDAAAPATRPASDAVSASPTTRSAIDAAVDGHTQLNSAISLLTKEYAAHLRDSKSPARSASSYFQDKPSADVTEDAIAGKLQAKLTSDVRVDSYTKWQLLSGIKAPANDKVAPRLLAAYRSAAAPAVLFGIDAQSRVYLERKRSLIVHAGDVDPLDREINDRQAGVTQANDAIIQYRNELFARLPVTYDALAAGLQDVNVRLNAGADIASIESPLADAIVKWMDDPKATAGQKNILASAIERMNDERIPCIQGAEWNSKTRQAKFQEKQLSLNVRTQKAAGQIKLVSLVKDLRSGNANTIAPSKN